MYLDGSNVWNRQRTDHYRCNNGWARYGPYIYDPWDGYHPNNHRDSNWHRCFYDIDYEWDHTSTSLQVKFDSNINGPATDESWGFSRVTISTDTDSGFVYRQADWVSSVNYYHDFGPVHGLWGNSPSSWSKTFSGLPKHAHIKVSARYIAYHTWDSEWAYFDVQGVNKWSKANTHNIWSTLKSYSNGDAGLWKYYDIEYVAAHSHSQVVLNFRTNIGQALNDEGWGIMDVRCYTDSKSSRRSVLFLC